MKLKYKHQRFQAEATRCVADVFRGQPRATSESDFLVDQGTRRSLFAAEGFGNKPLVLTREALCDNVRAVQMSQGLKPVEQLEGEGEGLTLTIEMETGTGKTYTYIQTMYELNQHYGWSKFVIVVPSIAIREGVDKSFASMAEHFAAEYGKRIQWFIYNSKQLSKIDAFAQDNGLHVMIINTQAFNTSLNEDKNCEGRAGDAAARIIFSRRDEFGSRRPIDILRATRPILIIDEPQSVLGTDKKNATRRGLREFQPLFTLLYSATHRQGDIYNMVYRLDAIDAYNKHLVKKVEVRSVHQVGTTATNGYLYLEGIVISKGNPQARISFDQKTATGTRQVTRLAGERFDLYQQSGELQEYRDNCIIERIDGIEGTVTLLNGTVLHEGQIVGEVNEAIVRRNQIRETIKTHLQRERELFPRRIKVLSLFFIDHVDNYRLYGTGGEEQGQYAKMFEEEYARAVSELMPTLAADGAYTRYLADPRNAPERTHDGYFSIDKKGRSVESKAREGENEERGFDLIMKDKEKLLSLDCPVRFIFSHSALKEGWDNPNVFQICTLKDTANEIKKRQEVGRGMRLCVNDRGERQDADVLGDAVFDTNILTVIASESYDDFARKLQTEIAEACGSRQTINISNSRSKKEAHFRQENFAKKEWQELWQRINTRTYYNVNFDSSKLVTSAIAQLDHRLNVTEIRIVVESGALESIPSRETQEAGVAMTAAKVRTIRVTEPVGESAKYDLVGELVQATALTRRTVVSILQGIKPATFHQFSLNPEEFIVKASRIINDCKALSLIQHISYQRRDQSFSSDIFAEATLRGTLGKNAVESAKSLYDLVVVDSQGIEKPFAESLEAEDNVVVYTKLPGSFYINTPMGKYNPDWAVAFREGTVKHVYFVAETKGNDIAPSQLRGAEEAKITCARRHFEAIADGEVVYSVVKSYQELYSAVMK